MKPSTRSTRLVLLWLLVGYALVAAVLNEAMKERPQRGGTMVREDAAGGE